MRWRVLWPHIAILAFTLLLAAVATYPLIGQLRDHLAKDADYHDPVCFVWNNWWIYHAITYLHSKPYFTAHLLVPFPLDLRLHTLGLLYGLASLPFIPWLGPVTVVNLQLLATPVLNGYAVFLLVRRWLGRDDVAIVCGGGLAFSPAIMFHIVSGRPSCGAIWPAVICQLFLMRFIEHPRWRNCLGLSASLVALLVVDQQMPIFAGTFFALYLTVMAFERPRALFNRQVLGYGSVVLLMAAYPLRLLYIRPFFQTPGYTTPHPSEALRYSMPLGFLLRPTGLWDAYGLLLPAGFFAAIVAARSDRRAAFGVACALLGIVLTFGPLVPGTHLPLPFALLRRLPGLAMFRTPYRFIILAAMGMTVGLAAVLAKLLARLSSRHGLRRVLIAGSILLVVADTSARRSIRGFATHSVHTEPIYGLIAKTPGDFVLLEVPFGVRSGTDVIGRGDDLMFHQMVHGKRMINGYLSRVPLVALDNYRKSPAFMFLANETPPPGDIAADLDLRIRTLGIGFIVIHPEMLDRDRFNAVMALCLRRTDLESIPTGTTTIAFRVTGVSPKTD